MKWYCCFSRKELPLLDSSEPDPKLSIEHSLVTIVGILQHLYDFEAKNVSVTCASENRGQRTYNLSLDLESNFATVNKSVARGTNNEILLDAEDINVPHILLVFIPDGEEDGGMSPLHQLTDQRFDVCYEFSVDDDNAFLGCQVADLKKKHTSKFMKNLGKRLGLLMDLFEEEENWGLSFHALPYLLPSEKKFIAQCHSNKVKWPSPCLPDLLFERVEEKREKPCLFLDDSTIVSYTEFGTNVKQLSFYLQQQDVRPDDCVGIFVEEAQNYITAAWGCLATGATFVPFDPSYPKERSQFMMEDTNMKYIITEIKFLPFLKDIEYDVKFLVMDGDYAQVGDLFREKSSISPSMWKRNYKPEHGAYCLYTSGSTGKPKGVLIEHHSINNVMRHTMKILQSTDTRMGSITRWSFDVHTLEVLLRPAAGHELVLMKHHANLDFPYLVRKIHNMKITSIFMTPTLSNEFLSFINDDKDSHSKLSSLVTWWTGGEALLAPLLHGMLKYAKVFNVYGPTECTVYTTCRTYTPEHDATMTRVPIGTPPANLTCHVLNTAGYPTIPGTPGLLYVEGEHVMREYLNLPQVMQKSVVRFPQVSTERLYNTGDYVQYSENGELLYLGRKDNQVKVRGQRLELGEIESVIRGQSNVRSVVVVKDKVRNVDELIAYVVIKEVHNIKSEKRKSRIHNEKDPKYDDKDEETRLKKVCAAVLPDYMVPTYYIFLDHLPLSQNQKVDRGRLPSPDVIFNHSKSRNNRGDKAIFNDADSVENKLIQIWSEVLNLNPEEITTADNFFELGGNSLLAARMVGLVQRKFKVSITIRDAFNATAIKDMCALLGKSGSDSGKDKEEKVQNDIIKYSKKVKGPTSRAQQRVYFDSRMKTNTTVYNVPVGIKFHGNLNIALLKSSLEKVVERHQSLRTVLQLDEHLGLIQVVLPMSKIKFTDNISNKGKDKDVIYPLSFKKINVGCKDSEGSKVRDSDDVEAEVKEILKESFDVHTDLPIRFYLLCCSHDQHVLVSLVHHHALDGVSVDIFVSDLVAYYSQEQPAPLPIQYLDYAIYEKKRGDEGFASGMKYWSKRLSGMEDHVIPLPLSRKRMMKRSTEAGHLSLKLSDDIREGISKVMKQTNTTQFMNFLAAVDILLFQYSREEDIMLGGVVGNRMVEELQPLVGMFANTIVYRNKVDPKKSYLNHINDVRDNFLEDFNHQNVPYDLIVQKLAKNRQTDVNPFFQVMVLLELPPIKKTTIKLTVDSSGSDCGSTVTVEPYQFNVETETQFDLLFKFSDSGTSLDLDIVYTKDIFDHNVIKTMADHLVLLANELFVEEKVQDKVIDLDYLLESEKKLLKKVNATSKDWSLGKNTCVPDLFIKIAQKHPNETCYQYDIVYETNGAFYNEVKRVALLFQEMKLPMGSIVGLFLQQPLHFVRGVWSVLLGGGAYCPMDPANPVKRLQYILNDTKMKVIVTESRLVDQVESFAKGTPVRVIIIDRILAGKATKSIMQLELKKNYSPQSLAYCLYTSGSTGNPKGVMIEHHSLFNYLLQYTSYIHTPKARILSTAPFIFDAHVPEILFGVIHGHEVILLQPGGMLDFDYLVNTIEGARITNISLIPSYLNEFLEYLIISNALHRVSSLTTLLVGGEALNTNLLQLVFKCLPKVILMNGYGPTECTVDTTTMIFTKKDLARYKNSVPIGRPIPNMQCYILDKHGYEVIPNTVGLLYVRGEGVMRGYLNLKDKTEEALIPMPVHLQQVHGVDPIKHKHRHRKQKDEDSALDDMEKGESFKKRVKSSITGHRHHLRMYATGDLARYNEYGEIVFLGREDHQVKINGQRLEIGEIESVIRGVKKVKNVVVLKVKLEDTGQDVLVAYILKDPSVDSASEGKLTNTIISACEKNLPIYMVPSFFEIMDKFPMSTSHKIDIKQLPPPKQQSKVDGIVLPVNTIEEVLVGIWSELLNIDSSKISTDVSFFSLGGTSLLLTSMVYLIRKELYPDAAVASLFEHRNIHKYALFLERQCGVKPTTFPSNDSSDDQDSDDEEVPMLPVNANLKWSNRCRSSLFKVLLVIMQIVGILIEWCTLAFCTVMGWFVLNLLYNSGVPYPWVAFPLAYPVGFLTVGWTHAFCTILWKWILLPYQPTGVYPIFGWYHWRIWTFAMIWRVNKFFIDLWIGSYPLNMYLRLLGMTIGSESSVYTLDVALFNLITIEDMCYIGHKVILTPYRIVDGMVYVGKIHIRRGSSISSKCVVVGGTLLAKGSHMPPYVQVDAFSTPQSVVPRYSMHGIISRFFMGLAQVFFVIITIILLDIPYGALIGVLVNFIERRGGSIQDYGVFYALFPWVRIVGSFIGGGVSIALIRLFHYEMKEGTYDVHSWFALWNLWLPTSIYQFTNRLLKHFVGTSYIPFILSMLGVHTSSSAILFDMSEIAPPLHLIKIEKNIYAGTKVMIGATEVAGGEWHASRTIVKEGSVFGNDCVLESGTTVPEGNLVGSLTSMDRNYHGSIHEVTFGIPPVSYPLGTTHPGKFVQSLPSNLRQLFDVIAHSVLPVYLISLCILGSAVLVVYTYFRFPVLVDKALGHDSLPLIVVMIPIYWTVFSVTFTLVWVVFKWLLLGKWRVHNYTFFGWWWTRFTLMYYIDKWWKLLVGNFLMGTVFLPWCYRMVGAKIGSDCLFFTFVLQEDIVTIGNRCIFERSTNIQPHTVDKGKFVCEKIQIGNDVETGIGALILPGVVLGNNVMVSNLTLLLRRDNLPDGSTWVGAPARKYDRATLIRQAAYTNKQAKAMIKTTSFGNSGNGLSNGANTLQRVGSFNRLSSFNRGGASLAFNLHENDDESSTGSSYSSSSSSGGSSSSSSSKSSSKSPIQFSREATTNSIKNTNGRGSRRVTLK